MVRILIVYHSQTGNTKRMALNDSLRLAGEYY
jgi:menaquinone-dependent protoporphyrinogen IX oxidase